MVLLLNLPRAFPSHKCFLLFLLQFPPPPLDLRAVIGLGPFVALASLAFGENGGEVDLLRSFRSSKVC